MADEKDYTLEEQEKLKDILNAISPDGGKAHFSPMQEQYQQDLKSLGFAEGPDAPVDEDEDLDQEIDGNPEDTNLATDDLGDLEDLVGSEAVADDAASPDKLGDLGDLAGGEALADDTASSDKLGDLGDLAGGEALADDAASSDNLGDLGNLGDLAGGEALADDAASPDKLGDLGDLAGGEALADDTASPDKLGDLGDLAGGEALADDTASPDKLGDLGDLAGGEALADDTASPDNLGDLGNLGDLAGGEALADDTASPDNLGDLGDLAGGEPLADDTASPDNLGDLGNLGDLAGGEAVADGPASPDNLGNLGGGENLTDFGDLTTPGEDTSIDNSLDDSFQLDEPMVNLDDSGATDAGGGLGGGEDDFTLAPLEAPPFENLESPSTDEDSEGLSDQYITELSEKVQLGSGIGKEFSDQELANIRMALTDYPASIKRAVIDTVVGEKVSPAEQRLLMNMLIDGASANQVADFIEAHLSYRPAIEEPRYTKEGLEIVYADELSPEALKKTKRRNRILLSFFSLGIAAVVFGVIGLNLYDSFYIKGLYDKGLLEIQKAQYSFLPTKRKEYQKKAEEYFQKALEKDNGRYNTEYLNRYGIAYVKARYYKESFIKLFGKAQPSYTSFDKRNTVPLIRKVGTTNWNKTGQGVSFTDQSGQKRSVRIAGAYMVNRLRDDELEKDTLINLGRFHSHSSNDFIKGIGRKYKNNTLAIDYYRLILTLMNKPNDTEALASIGDVYYKEKRLTKAATQYRKITDLFPLDERANASLLSTYIEIGNETQDPRMALAKHRELRSVNLEKKFPIYLMTKLANFYTQLERDDVLIKYQIDPVDTLTGYDLRDNAYHLLQLAFRKEEKRDDETIIGTKYAEGFYQRGLFLLKQGENLRALKQFQNAHNYDSLHYLAINQMGEYYKNINDFEKASQYFPKAIDTYKQFIRYAGNRPEDETLIKGDVAKIYYNAGSLLFLRYAGFSSEDNDNKSKAIGFSGTRLYPFRSQKIETEEIEKRRQKLSQAREYFEKALGENTAKIRDAGIQTLMEYWSGWIDYMNGDFSEALNQWEAIDIELQNRDSALLLGKANAYYYTNQMRNALGHYFKVKNDLEKEGTTIESGNNSSNFSLRPENRQMLLAAVYNNIGAVYESETKKHSLNSTEFQELEKNALLYYWKSMETARKQKLYNEIARTNIQLSFKDRPQRTPLIDDWLPPVLPTFHRKL